MLKSGFRIIIFPEGKSDMSEFSLSRSKLLFLLSSLLLVVSVIIIISVSIISKFIFGRNIDNLKDDKAFLNRRLHELISETDNLKREISELSQRDDELRLYAGIPRLDKEVKEVGVGGTPISAINFNGFFSDETALTNDVMEKLDELERRISLLNTSYEDISVSLKFQEEFRNYFPGIRPVVGGKTTDRFGYRIHPVTKRPDNHQGVDISIEQGTPVLAAADGTIEICGPNGTYGNFILIDHKSEKYGFKTGYGHLSKFHVKKGDKVKRGQIIGEVGKTGRSTAPHLHYEVRYNGINVDPFQYYWDPKVLK